MFRRPKLATTSVAGPGGQGFEQLHDHNSPFPVTAMKVMTFGASSQDGLPPSLRDTVRSRLFTDMIHSLHGEERGVIMLVDDFTVKLISSVMKMSELMEENIQLVEDITMKDKLDQYLRRQPLPTMTACYFLTPTVESVNRLLFDYRNKKAPMYGSIRLFFTSRLSESLLNKIKVRDVQHSSDKGTICRVVFRTCDLGNHLNSSRSDAVPIMPCSAAGITVHQMDHDLQGAQPRVRPGRGECVPSQVKTKRSDQAHVKNPSRLPRALLHPFFQLSSRTLRIRVASI